MKKIVILDAGHGDNTPGKRSPVWSDGKQLFEYEFNRDIVRRITEQLDDAGIEYRVLVPELTDTSLGERVRRINQIHNETGGQCFLLSIHANAGGGTGWENHIYTEKSKSKEYAIILANEAEKEFAPDWKIRKPFANQPYWISNFQILRQSKCPAVLTENFFMDNEKDCLFIMSETGRERVANMHVAAIKQII